MPSANKVFMQYWGKASKNSEASQCDYHLLPYHCLDVAAVAEIWLRQSRTLLLQSSLHLGLPKEETKKILLFYILLHDLGKFDARFQNFREDIRQSLQGSEFSIEPDLTYYSHGSCGYQQFSEMYSPNEAMRAVAGHHGYCDTSITYEDPDADEELIELDIKARAEWVEFCLTFCGLDEVPDVGEIPLLAGLCSVADWIGSSLTNFTTDAELDLYDYYDRALDRAKKALYDSGMLCDLNGAGFDFLFPSYTPRGIQKLLNAMPLEAGLTIVESDTGSGKTEFALAYASLLVQAGLADGVVFGLPTQATANGLFSRIGHATQQIFPDATVMLAHGKSKFMFSDESGFLHQSRKRAFLGSMSVATVDQILMGVLGVRHQFVRSFGTRKSVLILDEVHSFDAYMMGLVDQVLKGQRQSFGSVILLSATLPENVKKKLLMSYGGFSSSTDYPLISHTNMQETTQEFTIEESEKQDTPRRVNSTLWRSENLLPTTDQIKQINNWVKSGAMVAIICNTVTDAQEVYETIKSSQNNFPVDLFHARYTFLDRKKIESHVINCYGKSAKRLGRLLIATQVIEQSLDLDFDILISQIAPIEYLIQRMGRLWRHDRKSGTLHARSVVVNSPLFITLLPTSQISSSFSSRQVQKHYLGSGYVYQNIRLLFRTEQYLSDLQTLVFPECYRDAISFVHQDTCFSWEPEILEELAEDFTLKAHGSHYLARQYSASQSKPLNDVDPRCALLTREGEMSISVVLVNADGGLYHGGDYTEQNDREESTVSLSPKYAKGRKDEKNFCVKAEVGKDIHYDESGVTFMKKDRDFRSGD